MKILLTWLVSAAFVLASATDDFISQATEKHGKFGEKAARFLVDYMPDSDKENLTAAFLMENLDLALKARETFPWAKEIPEEIFLNDVLPYAVFDEPRDPWRADFLEKAGPLVKDAESATEAAQILNREFFKLINTHYNTERKRTNQSPKESIEQGRATCTGLSIILVDVCRAVGIPARAVGTPMWSDNSGNHTWVEIWDAEWFYTGADEYDEKGLNRGWFTEKAGKADSSKPLYGVYASSWKNDDGRFLMTWSPGNNEIGGINVTDRYATKTESESDTIGVRFFEGKNRVAKKGTFTTAAGFFLGNFETKAGTADLNDTPRLTIVPGKTYRFRFEIDGKLLETKELNPVESDQQIFDIRPADLTPVPVVTGKNAEIGKGNAARAIQFTYEEILAEQKKNRAAELEGKSITVGDHSLKWLEKTYGEAPPEGRSLWISMHGGGQTSTEMNDQQWQNQINLYKPAEGIYVAPRAPTDTWNLWHQDHIDALFSRLIGNMIALRNVDPDKVYLMGYSAGGDGVWQLAPRMADRFAAAAMMAGHPNEASLLPLRNLPFAIFMGGEDAAYDRNKIAAQKISELEALRKADPDGYENFTRIYPGMPHWMGGKDAEAVPWMEKFTRNPWPEKIVWVQDDVTHDRFYWLQLSPGTAAKGQQINASVDGQEILISGDVPEKMQILLSDELIDIDLPVKVSVNGGPARSFSPARSADVIHQALTQRLDPRGTPTAVITLD